MNDVTFIILGATGDLTKKKLIPAIYNIVKNKKVDNYTVVGVARAPMLKCKILDGAKKYIKRADKKIFNEMESKCEYFQGDFYDDDRWQEFSTFLKEVEKKNNTSKRIFYLATLPSHFEVIAKKLGKHKLVKSNSKVIFEKPFGEDLKSAKSINRQLKKVFKEKQIYRIDHYLGKELVQNVSTLRFTNEILEPTWNNKHIANVQIVLSENIGVADRANFYDKYGVVKDVIQNHALQLLALTAMEEPKKLNAKFIRDNKVKVLKNTKIKNYILGQYKDYEVSKSKTPTFAAIELRINNNRWKGVPFYILAGKNLKQKLTTINIEYKNSACKLLEGVCNFSPNHLTIEVQPKEGFHVHLNTKIPRKMQTMPVKMDFCHECEFGMNTPEAYENLIIDVIKGDQSVFIRTDEIEEQWKIVEKIKPTKLFKYKKGTLPKEANSITKWHMGD